MIKIIDVSHLARAQASKLNWEGAIQPKIVSNILELVDFGLKMTVAHLVVDAGVIKQENVNHRVQPQIHRLLPL